MIHLWNGDDLWVWRRRTIATGEAAARATEAAVDPRRIPGALHLPLDRLYRRQNRLIFFDFIPVRGRYIVLRPAEIADIIEG